MEAKPKPSWEGLSRQYLYVDASRLVVSSCILAAVLLNGQAGIVVVGFCVLHLLWSVVWLAGQVHGALRVERHPRLGYVPSVIEAFSCTLLVAVTGGVHSYAVIVCAYAIAGGASNIRIRQGEVGMVSGIVLYLVTIWSIHFGLLPSINVIGEAYPSDVPNMIVASLFVPVMMWGSYQTMHSLALWNKRLQEDLGRARDQSESLLHSILPASVAEELKRTGRAAPVLYDSATILFTDFVGFSTSTRGQAPQEVEDELNRCFTAFDAIVLRHGLERLKTIGDGYMAAAGLPEARTGHEAAACRAALEIRDWVAANRHEGFGWDIRIGLASGPVVAGVIGTLKFAYDVWGDTVNLASRHESACPVGSVNVSAAVRAACAAEFRFWERGDVEIKGGERLPMFELLGPAAAHS